MAAFYPSTSGTAVVGNVWVNTTTTSTTVNTFQFMNSIYGNGHAAATQYQSWPSQMRLAKNASYLLPDDALLAIDDMGNYRLYDKRAKIKYQANNVREFNPYINASDLLEKFIEDAGRLAGVDQLQILKLPIEAFINWLILAAAKKDGDSLAGLPSVESALPPPPAAPRIPRCLTCGRFIRRAWAAARVEFCSRAHMEARFDFLEAAAS